MQRLNPENISDINVSYFLEASRMKKDLNILVIQYSGKYKVGSDGAEDARYMFAKGEYALSYFQPIGAIIDLSDVDYVWGDDMELVLSIGMQPAFYENADFPIAIVVGEKCQEAIGTLINDGTESKEPATAKRCIFDNVKQALEFVEGKIEKSNPQFSTKLRRFEK